jgi:hypothetical protein
MTDKYMEFGRLLGVNGTVLGVTTFTELENALKIILLTATILWTGIKIVTALREYKNNGGKRDKKKRKK